MLSLACFSRTCLSSVARNYSMFFFLPAEVVELPSGLDSHSESSREAPGVSQESSDVQPSSSDSSHFSQPKTSAEVPTITITSALDSSLDSSPDVNVEGESEGAGAHNEPEHEDGM